MSGLDSLLSVLKTPELAADLSRSPEAWAEIKRQAEIHRFTGRLADATSASLPPSERSWRDEVLMKHHRRHQLFMRQLRIFVDAFADAAIPCVVLKGPLLAERVHTKPYLKNSHDLDLLVPTCDIPAAARLMNTLGFTLRGIFPWPVHRQYVHDIHFTGTGPVRTVEIHYALKVGAHMIPAQEFIDRAVEWQLADGLKCMILSPADECLYLIAHAAGHAFHRLRWLYDALMVAKTLNAAERETVRTRALEMQLTGYFVAADMCCREFFGEPLPLDLSGFKTPWLWSTLQRRHLQKMAQRETYAFGAHVLDICRISGTPLDALRLCVQNSAMKLPTLLYRLRGGATGPEVLARSLTRPDS